MPFDELKAEWGGGGDDPRHEGLREMIAQSVLGGFVQALNEGKCPTCYILDTMAFAMALVPVLANIKVAEVEGENVKPVTPEEAKRLLKIAIKEAKRRQENIHMVVGNPEDMPDMAEWLAELIRGADDGEADQPE